MQSAFDIGTNTNSEPTTVSAVFVPTTLITCGQLIDKICQYYPHAYTAQFNMRCFRPCTANNTHVTTPDHRGPTSEA